MEMEIVPGDIFVVHYKFPSGQKKFSEEEVRNGCTMDIPEAYATVTFPAESQERGVTVTYKVSFKYLLCLSTNRLCISHMHCCQF